ncbi:transcription factor IIIB 50 kDa subunit-like [Argonauta hians]
MRMADRMDMECPSCGEKAIMKDYHGTDEQYVCVECGSVVESSGLVSSNFDVCGEVKQFVPSKSGQSKAPNCPGFQSVMSYLETIGLVMKVLPEMEELAKEYLNSLYQMADVKRRGMEYKVHLALACLYISCRQHCTLYTLLEIARLARCNVFDLGSAYKTAVKMLNLNMEQPGIGALSRHLFSQSNLSVSVISRSHELLHLSNKFWLVDGRNPIGLLLAVSYISWKADKPLERCKISPQKYCKEQTLTYSPMVRNRINEIEEILFHLALELPWVKNKPGRERLPFLVKDILNYQQTLMVDMEKRNDSQDNCLQDGKNNYGEILPPIMKKRLKRGTDTVAVDTCASNIHGGDGGDNGGDDDDDDDSDSDNLDQLDVDDYIKSEQEIAALQKLE